MPYRKESPRFRRLLLNAVIIPLILMTIITAALIWQITYLLGVSAKVEHADRIIAKAYELQKIVVDLETGLRGFLLTGDNRFLEPYDQANSSVDPKEDQLRQALGGDTEREQLDQLIGLRKTWVQYAEGQIALRRKSGDYLTLVMGLQGKQQMDQLRILFAQLIDRESQLRDIRFRDAERAFKITLALITGFGLGGGIFLAFLSRKQFMLITQNYDTALMTAHDLNQKLEVRVNERTRDLEQRTYELTDLNRELEAFSYSISHDLRAPMRHIAGFANLLEQSLGPQLNPDDKENLTTIHQTAKLAGTMVDDLLMFSRVGRTPLRVLPVDLNALLQECRKELTPETRGRQIEWKIDPLPLAAGDPAMLKMVISNLLANAIKYTSKRENAFIEIGCCKDVAPREGDSLPQSAELVTCFVKDNGVGFDMTYADKLFGVFQRLHRSEDFEGTGIGLANVRRIIGRSGGRVWANGELGKGATFYFTVPLAHLDES